MKRDIAVKALLVILCVACLPTANGCDRRQQQPMSEAAASKAPDQEIWGSDIILSMRGQPRAKVFAAHILKFEDRHLILMDGGITVDFYDRQGNHASVLTAKGGEVDETSQNLGAAGNVVVVASDGSRLETEQLRWDHATQKILSDTLVAIRRGQEHIIGIGFESDADLKHWKIRENVTGQLQRVLKSDQDTVVNDE